MLQFVIGALADKTEPRDINRLRFLLGDGIEELKEWTTFLKLRRRRYQAVVPPSPR
ncbi:hypothetical protein ACLB1S_03605 [Escherichia coli]